MDRRSLDQLAREPLYNTSAVVQTTGVPADTFRAWERRYGVPRPFRTPARQRLYSALDIGVIGWLRDRTNEGMTISQAIQRLRLEHPDALTTAHRAAASATTAATGDATRTARLRGRLIEAAVAFDGAAARRAIDEAIDLFGIDMLADEIIQPALADLDARWRDGAIPVTAVRFASGVVQRRLGALFTHVNPDIGRGRAIVACPAGESHDLGALVVSILLAREGWQVVSLGADTPAPDLAATVEAVRPALVCLSATTAPAAECALDTTEAIGAGACRPPVVVGGPGFAMAGDTARLAGSWLVAGRAADVAAGIGRVLRTAGEW